MQKDIKFVAFIDSITPLINSFLQNGAFSQENSSHDHFALVFNYFKVKSKEKEIPFDVGISKVLATLIYDYLCIGIVTLRDNHNVKEMVALMQEKIVSEHRNQCKEPFVSLVRNFLNKLLTLIQDRNTKIPFFHNRILPIRRIISSLLENFQISMELSEFFIQNFKQPIFYDQMKTPYYFEFGIPWEHKQKHGQVFTPIDIVNFMCEQLISEETSFIIDPSAGTGLFLLGALNYYLKSGFTSIKTIVGIEKDPILALICESAILIYCKFHSISTVNCQIINNNLFNCDEILTQTINECKGNGVILMNPPYTRQELISNVEKNVISKKVESLPLFNTYKNKFSLTRLSGQSSLYVYFIIYISEFLQPLDRVGLIIPNSWMDVRYGEALKHFFLDRYYIEYIISTKLEKLIPSVEVNTSIILLHVKEISTKSLSSVSGRRVKFLAINSRKDLNQIGKNKENSQGTLAEVTETALLQNPKWSTYFKAPPFFFKLLARLQGQCFELETHALIKRGFTSGANAFFYVGRPGKSNVFFTSSYDSTTGSLILTPKNKKIFTEFSNQGFFATDSKFIIEREYWMHKVNSSEIPRKNMYVYRTEENTTWIPNYLIKSPKELSKYEITDDNINYIVLILPKLEKAQLKAGIRSYISWGEKWNPSTGKNYSKRTTCASRKFWYALSSAEYMNFPIVCMMTINDRFSFFYNTNNYFFDARLYGIQPITSVIDIPTLFCYLNSIFVSFQLELLGRVNLGEGGLDVKVYEYGGIKLNISNNLSFNNKITVRNTFNKMLSENPCSITNEKGNLSKRLLDSFLIDLKLFSKEDITKMNNSLQKIVQNRLVKARSVSNRDI
ncbi:MAG: N-6 DNA methylase [Candidatus Hodarchaeales archaeon]